MTKDFYTRKAMKEGYLARSVYKLKQINKKYFIIRNSSSVLDLGCFPGGWVQYCLELNCDVIGIDIKYVSIKSNKFTFLKMDVSDDKIYGIDNKFDVVLSDLAPKTTGVKELDRYRSFDLAFRALQIAIKKLKENGNFLVKIFQGKDYIRFLNECKKHFKHVKSDKPDASKSKSVEMYVVCKGFKPI